MPNEQDYLTLIDQEAGGAFKQSMASAVDAKPDTEAKLQALSRQYGVPVSALRLDSADTEKRAKLDAYSYESLVDKAPKTAFFLTDPDKARVAHDDVENLTGIERALYSLGRFEVNTARAFAASIPRLNEGLWGLGRAGAEQIPFVGKPAADYFARMGQVSRGMADRWAPKADGLLESSWYSGMQSLGMNLALLPAAAVSGSPAPVLWGMGLSTGGQAYGEARDKGVGVLPAFGFGASQGVIEAGTEMIGMPALFSILKPGRVGQKVLEYIVKDQGGEQIATHLQDLNEWAVLNPDKSFGDYLAERPTAALQTALSTLFSSGGQAAAMKGIEFAARRGMVQVQQADAAFELLDKLNKLAQADKLASRDPETFEQFIAQVAEGSPVQTVFIDANTLMQSGVAEQVAAASPAVAAQLEAAVATGGQIAIPVEEYTARIAPTEYAQGLLDHLKTEPEGFSRAEAQQFMQSHAEELQAEVERTLAEKQVDDTFKASAEVVRNEIRNQLDTAARFTPQVNDAYSAMMGNFYATMAAKMGTTPEELFQRYPLKIAAERIDGAGLVLDQGEVSQTDQIDEITGLPLNTDGTVTVYHHTSAANAEKIRREGWLRSAGEPDLYFTTHAETDTGYGDTAIPVRVRPERLQLDDEFPEGRQDYRVEAPTRGRRLRFLPDGSAVLNQQASVAYTADTIEVDGVTRPTTNSNGKPIAHTEEGLRNFWRWFSPSPSQLLDGLSVAEISSLKRDAEALADFIEGQSSLPEPDRFSVIPSSVFSHMSGVVDNRKILDAVVRSLPVDVVDFLSGKKLSAKEVLHDSAMLENMLTVDPASDVSLGINPSGVAELLVRVVANAGAKISGLTGGALERNSAVLADANDPVLGAHVRKSSSGDLGIIAGFGDSKVVDADGKPLVVYHGGTVDHTFDSRFNGTGGGREGGFFFTPDIRQAKDYAGTGSVKHAYLSASNLLMTDAQLDPGDVADAKKEGYDGYWMVEEGIVEESEIVVFDPTQIKSATQNRGTFDPNDPNILHQLAGPQFEQGGVLRAVDVFGNGLRVDHYDDRKGLMYSAQQFPTGTRWTVFEAFPTEDGGDQVLGDMFKYKSLEEAQAAVRGLRISATQKAKSAAKYGAIPNLWKGEEKKVAKALIDAGIGIERFASSTQSRSKYLYLDSGLKVRLADHVLPGNYDRPDVDYRYGGDIKALVEEVKKAGEGAPAPDSGELGSRSLGETKMQERPTLRADESGPSAEPAQSGSGAGSEANIAGSYGQSNGARGAFNPASLSITLLKNADLSTFLHESGHFFLEVQADLASKLQQEAEIFGMDTLKPGERQILADTDALLKWFGLKDLNEWNGLDFEQKRSYHEQFARGFEAYLFEGKAPSIELQGLFQRFRAWLLSVYRELKALNVELTDEVRGVFDRLLATNEQITLAEQGRSMMPLFKNFEDAQQTLGWTVEQYAEYQALGVQSTQDAIEDLQARGLRDMQWRHNARGRIIKQLQRQAKEQRAAVEMDVRREVMSQPIYRAWQFLTGKLTADDKVENPTPPKSSPDVLDETLDSLLVAIAKLGGINKAEAVSTWGIDPKDKPQSGVFGKPVWRLDGGLSLDGMAEALSQYGYLDLDEHGKWDLRDLEEKFRAELGGDPAYSNAYDYAAQHPVKPGEQIANPGGLTAGRLALDGLDDLNLPVELVNHLKALRMTAKNGLHPDIVAEMFGFTSGDELVRKLAQVETPSAEIDALTDVRMLEQFGDLSSPEAIEKAADKAIHNDARARFVATEANALAKATGQRKVLASAAKEFARAMIARLKVRNIKPGQYANAEVRAAKAAEKASKSGDLATAAAEKRNQIIQIYATRAAYDAQENVDRGLRYLKKFEGDIKGLDADYADQIGNLLERFDLRKGQSNKAVDKRTALAEWIKAQREAGLEPYIPPELENEAFRTSYKNLTVEEFQGLVDTVRQIEHLGRLKHKLLTAADQRAYEAVRDEIAGSVRAHGGKPKPVSIEEPGRARKIYDGFMASNRKLSSLARQMDGAAEDGPLYRYLIAPMNERGTWEAARLEQAAEALDKLYAPILALPGGTTGAKQQIPGTNQSITRGGRLALALNWGNLQNRERILMSNWGAGTLTEQQVEAVLSSLSREELAFVNGVHAFIDAYWPEIEAKERRIFGKAPDKVEALPYRVTLANGETVEMRGGYYPIKYDTTKDDKAAAYDTAEAAKDVMRGAFTAASTRRGHTKARAEEVKRPVRLSLDVITEHTSQVVHDLAWHEWLIDANRLLRSKTIGAAIRDHYGDAVLKTMRDALPGIAGTELAAQDATDHILRHLRANVSAATLGWSIATAMLQPFGILQSVHRIGAKHVLRGMARWAGDTARFENTVAWISDKSDFMRLRNKTFNRELFEIQGRVSYGKGKARRVYEASLFFLMQKLQMIADVPTWVGAYEKGIDQGLEESDAIAQADRAVIESQGGGQTKDLTEFQRKHPMLTMFYSYFSLTYNLMAESTARTDWKKPLSVGAWMGDMALLSIIPALGPALIMSLLRGDDEDDPEEWAKRLVKWQAAYLLGLLPGLRELSGSVEGYGYAGPPVGRIVGDIGNLMVQLTQGEADEGLALASTRLSGTLLGVPVTQLIRSYRGWEAWADGDAPVTGVLLGPPPKD